MTRENTPALGLTLEQLRGYGILLESDPGLPSVASLVAGGPVSGSWWGHSRGGEIHEVTRALADHPDVVVTKLVSGKVTYVHRRLWAAIIAIGTSREPWQLRGLSPEARSLLAIVAREGEIRTDSVPPIGGTGKRAGEAARELERNLLVHGEEVHTLSGAHAKRLETWSRWASRIGFVAGGMPAEQGRRKLEEALESLNQQFGGRGRLPWVGRGP